MKPYLAMVFVSLTGVVMNGMAQGAQLSEEVHELVA